MKKIKIICTECRSEEVRRDAYAIWSVEDQKWELLTVFDTTDCEVCGREVETMEIEIESEASPKCECDGSGRAFGKICDCRG
jgi:hypothetical protein